ncbi:tryptophan halogenase family protein [Catenovulum sediminis]|uniref:Tryptophan halogenase family protein n=1 Tax=Catenovulum sediminis TaxID=1740262 RepID=A0ABV1RJ44_9ALTE
MSQFEQSKISSIVIVGGGTAGWLTAGILASELRSRIQRKELCITLIESPNIPTIGVGEGTWPTMPNTLNRMGVSETEFIRECDASFKQGSKFVNWGSEENTENNFYYHPFDVPMASMEGVLPEYWLEQEQSKSLAESFTVQQALCEANKAPKNITHAEFGREANYGYHLDAGKFSNFLKKHCIEKLGVKHIFADVEDVTLDPSGNIKSISLGENGPFTADLFVDCTGFKSLLLGKALNVKFNSVSGMLFADTAIVTQVKYPQMNAPIKPYTQSTAQTCGWIWDIGLPTRRGVGYVYSSEYTDTENAKKEIDNYISKTTINAQQSDYRTIQFTPGYRDKFWHKNCVAVGLSAGFLEPLEASALVMVELSAYMIAEQLPATKSALYVTEKRFNKRFRYHWQRAIDFLKLHYILSKRNTPFWLDNRKSESIPDSLQHLMVLWRHQVPKATDFELSAELFNAPSYQFVLYGTHFRSELLFSMPQREQEYMQQQVLHNQQLTGKLIDKMPDHRSLINKIVQYGLAKV